MKKFFRFIFILIIIGIVGIGGFYAWLSLSGTKNRDALTIVPSDAVFVAETNNFAKGWKEISSSDIWKHFLQNKTFGDINNDVASIDSLMQKYGIIERMLKDRRMLFSTHMISGYDFDFLYIVDLQKAHKISFVKEVLPLIEGVSTKKSYFKGIEVIELTDNTTKETVYMSIIDNLFVASFSKLLVEDAILNKDLTMWSTNRTFTNASQIVRDRRLFNLYLNFEQLNRFTNLFLEEEEEMLAALYNTLLFSVFDINIDNNKITFDGYTISDSLSSYIKALSGLRPAKMESPDIISDQAAFCLSLCFDDFDDFHENLVSEFKNAESEYYKDYEKNIREVEEKYDIDFDDVFFPWVGNEISFVKLRPTYDTRMEDIVVLLHTKDIEDAMEGFQSITEALRKKSPIKFKEYDYNEHTIHYLDLKNFFKLFFGRLFKNIEKPYFTYMDDFVVFTNSEKTLRDVIDARILGNVLNRDAEFTAFHDNFEDRSNVSVYIDVPKMYSNFYYYSNKTYKPAIKRNKELILSMKQIGFQLVAADDNGFQTKLIAKHDPDATFKDEVERIEIEVENKNLADEIENLEFQFELDSLANLTDSSYTFYYPDSAIRAEGSIEDSLKMGIWRGYYPTGNLHYVVNYQDGRLTGDAYFFFNTNGRAKKAEAVFDNNKLINEYRQYYDNGAQKSVISYKDGLKDGKAQYFYKTGALKVEGKFKDGEKKGKWKYYTEKGEVFDKERYRKGELR